MPSVSGRIGHNTELKLPLSADFLELRVYLNGDIFVALTRIIPQCCVKDIRGLSPGVIKFTMSTPQRWRFSGSQAKYCARLDAAK